MARSIGSVGLYVPGGTAVLPSTALMLAVVSDHISENIFFHIGSSSAVYQGYQL